MKLRNGISTFAWVVCATAGLAVTTAQAGDIDAITRPSEEVVLSFLRPGRIGELLVKDGQKVQAGELLVRLDDTAEQLTLQQLRAEAENVTRIAAAQAELDQKRTYLEELQEILQRGSATKWEIKNAELDVTIGELRLAMAEFEHAQSQLKLAEARTQLDRMRMKSPIAGRVERVFVKLGESADSLENIVYVVNTDPLWIETPVPLEQARNLKPGQLAEVRFDQKGTPAALGTIIHVAGVADAASSTLNVRMEVPNPTRRPAGEHVQVRLPSE